MYFFWLPINCSILVLCCKWGHWFYSISVFYQVPIWFVNCSQLVVQIGPLISCPHCQCAPTLQETAVKIFFLVNLVFRVLFAALIPQIRSMILDSQLLQLILRCYCLTRTYTWDSYAWCMPWECHITIIWLQQMFDVLNDETAYAYTPNKGSCAYLFEF